MAETIEDATFALPEGTLIEVTMTVRLPCAATEDQVGEWLDHNVGQCGGIDVDNPLYRNAPEAWGPQGLKWSDTGYLGTQVDYDHQGMGPGRTTYRTRYERTRRD